MVRGSSKSGCEVLKDTRVGIGGIGALFLVYAPAVAALAALCAASPWRAALALLAGEVSARSAMLLTLAFGKPAEPGSSSVPFVRALAGSRRALGLALALLAPLPPGSVRWALSPCSPYSWRRWSRWSPSALLEPAFGGIGGDVVGAAGEACRAVVLILVSAMM